MNSSMALDVNGFSNINSYSLRNAAPAAAEYDNAGTAGSSRAETLNNATIAHDDIVHAATGAGSLGKARQRDNKKRTDTGDNVKKKRRKRPGEGGGWLAFEDSD